MTRAGCKQLEKELANWARLSAAINLVVQEVEMRSMNKLRLRVWGLKLRTTRRAKLSQMTLRVYAGKKLMPSLAVLFELADRAAAGFEGIEGLVGDGRVSWKQTCRAIEWCMYLESHARRIYC